MTDTVLRQRILYALSNNGPMTLEGLCDTLGETRADVWSAVCAARMDGLARANYATKGTYYEAVND